MHVNARWLAVMVASALTVVACAPPSEGSESSSITDRELSELQQEAVPPALPPSQAASGKTFYVRVAWGLLAGDPQARSATDWAGSLSLDQGTLHLSQLNFVEGGDHPSAQVEPNRVSWSSQTQHAADGLVARVEVPSDDATLTLDTPSFHREIRASELTGGDDAVFPVDASGLAVSISSIAASSCKGGFVLGYLRPGSDGSLSFGGRTTDRTGAFAGRIRFQSADDGTVSGTLVAEDGRVEALVRGTVVRELDGGGSISAELVDPRTSRTLGSLTGVYAPPTYASRGAFQGSFEQSCNE